MSSEKNDKLNLEDSSVTETTGQTRKSLDSIRPTESDKRSVHPKSDPPEIIQVPGYTFIESLNPDRSKKRSIIYCAMKEDTRKVVVVKQYPEEERSQYEQEKAIQGILKEKGGYKHLLLANQFIDENRVIITDFMGGGDLRQLLKIFKEKKVMLNPYQAQGLVAGSCKGLQRMHDCNIIHRDVKEGNMFLDAANFDLDEITPERLKAGITTLKFSDYGISWHESVPRHSEPGRIAGTIYYLAPEIISGGKPDPRSDIYALGIVYFKMFTGEFPFKSDVFRQQQEAPLPDMTKLNTTISKDLQHIVETMLEKDPDKRYQTATNVRKAYFQHLR